jgi:hypothetical protein
MTTAGCQENPYCPDKSASGQFSRTYRSAAAASFQFLSIHFGLEPVIKFVPVAAKG